MPDAARPLSSLPFRWGGLAEICFNKLVPALPSKLQVGVFLYIYGRTIGAPGRPRFTIVNLVQLARLQKATPMGVGQALQQLVAVGLIEASDQKAGRSRQYRIAIEKLTAVIDGLYRESTPRKLKLLRKPPHSSGDSVERRRGGEGDCGNSKSNIHDSTATCRFSEFSNAEPEKEREDSHEIPPPESKQISEEQSVGTIPPNRAACPYCSPNFGETKTPQSPEFQEFERWAYPDIARMIGAAPPPGLSNRVFAVLGDAPIEGLKKRVIRRIKAFEEYGWGLLIQLADDVRKAHEIAYKEPPRHEPKKYNPADPCTILLNGFADLLAGRVRYDLKPTRGEWVGMAGEAYDLAS